jgi:hypothetical protein
MVHTKRCVASDNIHAEERKRVDNITVTKHVYETTVVSVCRKTWFDPSAVTTGFVADNDALLQILHSSTVDNTRDRQHCYTKHYVDNTCDQQTALLYETLRMMNEVSYEYSVQPTC